MVVQQNFLFLHYQMILLQVPRILVLVQQIPIQVLQILVMKHQILNLGSQSLVLTHKMAGYIHQLAQRSILVILVLRMPLELLHSIIPLVKEPRFPQMDLGIKFLLGSSILHFRRYLRIPQVEHILIRIKVMQVLQI